MIAKSRKKTKKGIVMVFGVFDGLHEGHRYFLEAAREYGSELIAVVARDETVRLLKNKTPQYSEEERRLTVARLITAARPDASGRAVLGDRALGSYAVIKKYRPDVICLGYDQDALAGDLEKRMKNGEIPAVRLVRLAPHEPQQWHATPVKKGLRENR